MNIKRKMIKNPPKNVYLRVRIPKIVNTTIELNAWLRKMFRFVIDVGATQNEESEDYTFSDDYGELFYNADLRSYMGYAISCEHFESPSDYIDFYIHTRYYIEGWEDKWEKLVRSSEYITEHYEDYMKWDAKPIVDEKECFTIGKALRAIKIIKEEMKK